MKKDEWIDAHAACTILGVKRQTLYSYVSRGKLRTCTLSGDARQSLYLRHEIEAICRQKRRPRGRAEIARTSIRWGEPVLPTRISGVKDGKLFLRSHRIEQCADALSLEEVAELLCDIPKLKVHCSQEAPMGGTTFTRAMDALLQDAKDCHSHTDASLPIKSEDVARILGIVTGAVLQEPGSGPIHTWIANAWDIDTKTEDIIRRCLVLLSDHELNPSTFAVRVCASTKSSLSASLLTGVATLSGPLHGSASCKAYEAVVAVEKNRVVEFREKYSSEESYSFGFGHPMYPNGDPRAAYLISHIPADSNAAQAVRTLSTTLGLEPNIDVALAAIARHYNLPKDAPEALFCIARTVGWIAHAIEQMNSGFIIRPRAFYDL